MNRRGMGKGRGKGYRNIIGKDPKVHSLSARGIKQPQRIGQIITQQKKITNNSSDWKKTQSTDTFEQWEFSKDKGFGKKIRGSLTLIKIPGYPKIRYGIIADVYSTKEIGLQGGEGLTKVYMNRTYNVGRYDTALTKIKELQKQMTEKVKTIVR